MPARTSSLLEVTARAITDLVLDATTTAAGGSAAAALVVLRDFDGFRVTELGRRHVTAGSQRDRVEEARR